MQVARGGHAQAALQAGREVGDDVPEHVRGHDHLELPRIAHELQGPGCRRRGASASISGYSAATALKTRCHRSWAWMRTFDLSAITTFVRPVAPRELEGVAHDALDALAGVEVDLGRHLVRRCPS